MPREIAVVPASDPAAVQRALAEAFAGGPIVLPRPDEALADAVPIVDDAPDDACLIVETSGSTSAPKRVLLTARALHASAAATTAWLDTHLDRGRDAGAEPGYPTRQWLLCLPAHYIAGVQVLVRSLLAGTQPVIALGRFDPDDFAARAAELTAERHYVSLVPVQLQRLLAADSPAVDAACRRFDAILVGGQATPQAVKDAARARGWRLVTTYGASESAGGCVYNGEPLPGVEVRIDDGEVLLGGPTLAAGYVDDAARDAAAFVERGGERWYRTSDAGELVEREGRVALRVAGRLDRVLISGGEKVNLDAVERRLHELDRYLGAVAIAAPHDEWGETVVIVVDGSGGDDGPGGPDGPDGTDGPDGDNGHDGHDAQGGGDGRRGAGADLDGDAELAALRDHLAPLGRAARPTRLIRVDALPRLASGKPDRLAIAELARAGE